MKHNLIRSMAVAILAALVAIAAHSQPVRDRIMRVDVVELLGNGKQVDGEAQHAALHGKFTYWFASEANMMTFLMNPEKYEVQQGGACARMGPLSGEGTTKHFATHNGRLYLFASEQCKARFLETPDAFIESPDPVPSFTEESRKRGRALLGKAVDAIACVAGIDNLTSYQEVLARDEESGGKNYHVTSTLTFQFPNMARTDTCWNDSCWGNAMNASQGWSISSDGAHLMAADQTSSLRREINHPLTILRARNAKDLIITTEEMKRTITTPDAGDVEVDLVTVHLDGVTTVLGIDDNGHVRLMTYRGRGPNATMGTIERIYSAFHDIGGVKLPGRVDVTFEGKPVAEQSGAFARQTINDKDHAKLFEFDSEIARQESP